MKKTQAAKANATSSKASASKKQSVLPMTPTLISPEKPKRASMLSITESIIRAKTGENVVLCDKPLHTASTEILVPTSHQRDCEMSEPYTVNHFFLASI